MATLVVNEIFHSIQGESTWVGHRCVFVRLTGCHLRCHYCDTAYAFHEGRRRSVEDVIAEVEQHDCELVEVTGGEPLLQPNVHELMRRLCDAGRTVLVETSGACDIAACDPRVIRIMDLKTSDSGEAERNLWSNIEHLNERDEVKFVLCSRRDYEWMREVIAEHDLDSRVKAILVSPVAAMPAGKEIRGVEGLDRQAVAEWILADRLPVIMQAQLHKVIWDPMARGV